MLEVNVTRLITDLDPAELSGSIAERGQNAGPETWNNSLEAAQENPVLADDNERQQARDYFRGFGAWDSEEIAAWSDSELDALVLQYAAGSLREYQSCFPGEGLGGIDWEELEEDGSMSGTLFAVGEVLYVSLYS